MIFGERVGLEVGGGAMLGVGVVDFMVDFFPEVVAAVLFDAALDSFFRDKRVEMCGPVMCWGRRCTCNKCNVREEALEK